jgi:L,D-transpeptidase YcbB
MRSIILISCPKSSESECRGTNAYDVYLHDTPTQALFAKSRRDFSHGCIRIEQPDELAAWVLRDKPEWTLDRIREAKRRARPLQVNLDRPIPVLIFYGTAVVGENGEVCFFDDIYGHDASLQQVLDRGYPYSDGKPTSAERVRRQRE